MRLDRVLRRLRDASLVMIGKADAYPMGSHAFHHISFAQEGEDGILARLFENQATGLYVDVGAHHPQRFSNTYRLYLRGWRGINLDPLPGSKVLFDRWRPRDINLQAAIGADGGTIAYHRYEESAFNGLGGGGAKHTSPLIGIDKIPTRSLASVFDEHLGTGQVIDFLSVDVEGMDEQVLRSNNWARYRPRYVLAEALNMRDVEAVTSTELHRFMRSVDYTLYSKCVNTLFFKDGRFIA